MLVSRYTQTCSYDNDSSAVWHSVFGRPMLVPNILSEHLIKYKSLGIDPKVEEEFGSDILEVLLDAHILIETEDRERKAIDGLFLKHNKMNRSKVKYLSLIMCEECPFRCTYCIHFANSKHYYNKEKMMTEEIAKKSIDEYFKIIMNTNQPSAYINFGGGEPLLNYAVIEKILPYIDEYRAKLGIPIRVGLNTNMSLLTAEMAKNFIRYDVEVAASLDGTKEGNDKVRLNKNPSGTYDSIIRGFKILEDLGRPLKSFAMTVTEANFSDVDEEIIDWAVSKNTEEVRIDIDIVGFVDVPINIIIDRLKRIRSYARTKGISVIGFWSRAAENLGLIPEEEDIGFCGGERGNSVCVAPSGQVFPCGYSNYEMGSFEEISNIHQNAAYKKLLERRNLLQLEDCADCPIFGFCRGGCLITKEANDDPEKQSTMCKLYVEMTKAIICESIEA